MTGVQKADHFQVSGHLEADITDLNFHLEAHLDSTSGSLQPVVDHCEPQQRKMNCLINGGLGRWNSKINVLGLIDLLYSKVGVITDCDWG